MTDWTPPEAPSATPPPHPPAYAPSWTPYPGSPPPPLPFLRTTRGIVLIALLCLFVGGIAGVGVTIGGVTIAGLSGVFDPDVTTYGPGGDLAAFAIGGGQCAEASLADVGPAGYAEGSGVPCDRPHAIEHFASAEPPTLDLEGGRFSRSDLATFADGACTLAFAPYVGEDSTTSSYSYRPIIPSEQAWSSGVHTVHCVLWMPDGVPDSGSAHGSNG